MTRAWYVIGSHPIDGTKQDADYYVEGFCIPSTWTARQSCNGYSNKRDAIREAKRGARMGYVTFVEPSHDPFNNVQPVWSVVRPIA